MTVSVQKKNDFKKFIENKNFKKIFILSGKKSFFLSGANKMFDNRNFSKDLKFFFKKSYYPDYNELIKIILELDDFKPDLFLAIGGGSVIDYAKIANIVKRSDLLNIKHKIKTTSFTSDKAKYPLTVIPTTAGSGAEVTSNAVIYLNKKKFSFEDKNLVPRYYFILPELIFKNSFKLKAASGFDAISQSIESIISVKSTPMSINFAKKSLELSLKNYLSFLKNPSQQNTFEMCMAANFSGKAINISKTTAPHALSYPFTAHYGISHGHAVSLTIEKFLIFNYFNMSQSVCEFDLRKRYEFLFKIFKVKNIYELCAFIKYMKNQAKLEDDFIKLGINIVSSYSKILDGVNILRLRNNPVILTKKDLKNILL